MQTVIIRTPRCFRAIARSDVQTFLMSLLARFEQRIHGRCLQLDVCASNVLGYVVEFVLKLCYLFFAGEDADGWGSYFFYGQEDGAIFLKDSPRYGVGRGANVFYARLPLLECFAEFLVKRCGRTGVINCG